MPHRQHTQPIDGLGPMFDQVVAMLQHARTALIGMSASERWSPAGLKAAMLTVTVGLITLAGESEREHPHTSPAPGSA